MIKVPTTLGPGSYLGYTSILIHLFIVHYQIRICNLETAPHVDSKKNKNKRIRCLSTVACKEIRKLKKGKAGRPNFKFKAIKIPFYSPPQHETVINNPTSSTPIQNKVRYLY